MANKLIKITISILIGGFFLWLAFKNVRFNELTVHFKTMNYGWLFPYFITVCISHYARAERWLLLVESKNNAIHPKKKTLFTGVMIGYLVNYAIPRLGEVSRSVYVAKKEHLSTSNLFGTIILERILDLLCLGLLLLFVSFYLVSDTTIMANIFGEKMINYLANLSKPENILTLMYSIGGIALLFVVLMLGFYILSKYFPPVKLFYDKFISLRNTFIKGMLSIKNIDNWWLFILWTSVIWFGYILMVYIPFWMFDLHIQYNLNILDAVSIMTIASIGIVLPSPGGVGTYHYFVKQALLFLATVPSAIGLAFGLVTHAVMFIAVVIITLVMIILDRSEDDFSILNFFTDLKRINGD